MKNIKESDIQKSIKEYLEFKKYVVVKFPSVGIYDQRSGTYIPQSRKGVSDLLACSPTGRYVAIEVKKKGNTLSDAQQLFLDEINQHGGLAFVAYSIDDVIAQGI